ncbi:DUF1697 domain-containing protein [Gracilibacillus alcaliphilus]|uniref:DUF1697 domain-containing protein n=1 Tax=Gracilibacillus alcaliphilus TaxID=1401441 RepID=UPI0019585AB9|nr:DUF1697 domain-containing protein [Gracilibacillus alcaliphilus]MBM7676221.1 uncharacterized protein (DUF1697 family) [Gracilibacillus alcaliphilus]
MTTYIALLRGINVGGHNKIKMVELRDALTLSGLTNVKTYIQSGNVIFQSEQPEDSLQKQIEDKIWSDFHIRTSVVLRNAEEWQVLMEGLPFSEQKIADAAATAQGQCLHVAMLAKELNPAVTEQFLRYTNEQECGAVKGRDIYLLFNNSIRNAKLANQLNKLEVPATVRNWKTICKIGEIVQS